MSQNVYYSEWQGELGTYRIEFYAASDAALTSPVYIEIPEDVVVFKKFSSGFDKFPLGMAKAPAVEFNVRMQYAYEFSSEFASLFTAPSLKLNTGVAFVHSFYAGTILKIVIDGDVNFFVVRDEVEIDIDMLTGEIEVEAVHYAKTVLDAIDFAPLAKGYYLGGVENKGSAVELWWDAITFAGYFLTTIRSKHTLHFVKYTDIYVYISALADKIKQKLLRMESGSFAISFPDFKPYRQNYANPAQLGEPLELRYNDCYVLAYVKKSGNVVGGVLSDSGLLQYRSAWEYYVDIAESFLARIYATGDGIIVRPLLGRYGIEMANEQVESEQISEAKLTVNYARLGVVVGSRIESNASDVSRYESHRPASRAAGEFTIPIVYTNVPVAGDYKKVGANSQHCFDPHSFGLYYIYEGVFHKIHHYMEYYLTNTKLSSALPSAVYQPLPEGWQDLLKDNAKLFAIMTQSQSGSHKWAAETLRAVYDRSGQSAAEIKFKPVSWYSDPYALYWTFDVGDVADYIGVLSDKWLAIELEFDFKTEEYSMKLITVPEDAI